MKSWRALRPGMIHTYWQKKLTAFSGWLAAQMSELYETGTHLALVTQDRIIPLMKDSHKAQKPFNNWLITSLSTTWKLLFSSFMQVHGVAHEQGTNWIDFLTLFLPTHLDTRVTGTTWTNRALITIITHCSRGKTHKGPIKCCIYCQGIHCAQYGLQMPRSR